MRFLSYLACFQPFLVSFAFVLVMLLAPLAVRPSLAQSSPRARKPPNAEETSATIPAQS
jgi:hypothetical protein